MDNEDDIAIVGLACRFPGARNPDEFWRNLIGGVESITWFSDEEMLAAGVPRAHLVSRNYVKAAPILDEPGHFDAGFFGFAPIEAKTMDPQHRILLELAHEALECAGCDPERFAGRIGVYAGSAMNTYYQASGLGAQFAEDYIPTLIGNDKDFLSTRISYKLNLKGPSLTVQTACSTSLVAVHLARQSLLSEETDIALVGAISVRVPHKAGYFFDAGGVVSPDGHVRAFDAAANGTVFGSGGAMIVLKRLEDALAGGDTIYAVVKGSAVNNDGANKAGYTAPSVDSQSAAVVEALANAGLSADNISYIEAHGSGTPVGDPIEILALTKAFRSFTQRNGFCAIGSVKTNVGHLDAAAGLAGILKTVLALRHRQIPASLNYSKPNAEVDFSSTPFYVNDQLVPWKSDGPRRAGVMATGMGGTNAHLILEEAPAGAALPDPDEPALLVLSAKTEAALPAMVTSLVEFLEKNPDCRINDVAYTLQVGRRAFSRRRYAVATGRQDAIAALKQENAKRFESVVDDAVARRPLILMLPGVGDHYVGMGRGLYERFAVFREEVDRCAQILRPHLGVDIRDILYPKDFDSKKAAPAKGIDLRSMVAKAGERPQDPATSRLNQTAYVQPALFTIEYATCRLWLHLGIVPDAIVGHSMGEYVAACLAGVLSLEDALQLIATRAKLVSALPEAAMLAVTLGETETVALLGPELSISLINGPNLCIVAGPVAAIAQFEQLLNGRQVISRRVQNSHAFHSRMLDPIVGPLEQEVRGVRLKPPAIPYISNVTGKWITSAEATDPAYWARHANHTARFSDALQNTWKHRDAILLEAGPGRTVGVLAMQHPERRGAGNPVAISSLPHHYENLPEAEFFLQSIGKLWLAGVTIDWDKLHDGKSRRKIALPTYPFERRKHWIDAVPAPAPAARAEVSIHKNPKINEWFYLPSWKRTVGRFAGGVATPADANPKSTWLVCADACGLAPQLVAKLEARGHHVVTVKAGAAFAAENDRTFTIDPANEKHYESVVARLLADNRMPGAIVHAWSVSTGHPGLADEERFQRAQSAGFYSLIFLTKAVAKHNFRGATNLFVVSNHVQEVVGSEELRPEKATILGPCTVIRQEYPGIITRSVDLEWPAPAATASTAVDQLAAELLQAGPDLCVAFRNAQRWIQTHDRVLLPEAPGPGPGFRTGGVYLITGGLGSIGLEFSRYLARKYRAKLVLVGRTALPARETWTAWLMEHAEDDPISRQIRGLVEVETLGAEVLCASADVSDAPAMNLVFEQTTRRFGGLHGVIHAAGLVGANGYVEVRDATAANCLPHFRAKALGLDVLARLLEGLNVDFCLLLSSLASVLGGIGQAPYAAANIYLDTFSRRGNRSPGVAWISVDWDVWRIQNQSGLQAGMGKTLEELGMNGDEAMAAVEQALALKDAGPLVVSTGDLQSRINQWTKLESFERPSGADSKADRAAPTGAAAGPAPRMDAIVTGVWQRVLGLEHIGPQENFFDLGGHSLLLIKVHSELRNVLNRDLSLISLFQHPTIASLTTHLEAGSSGPPAADDAQIRADRQRLAASRRRTVVRN